MKSTHNIPSMQELAELATLDAYGLLDESDLFRLEQAMLHAPSAGRARGRAVQDEIATDEHLLPEATPPERLRQQVLDRVRAAIDLHDVSHPTASIAPSGIQEQPLSFSWMRSWHRAGTGVTACWRRWQALEAGSDPHAVAGRGGGGGGGLISFNFDSILIQFNSN